MRHVLLVALTTFFVATPYVNSAIAEDVVIVSEMEADDIALELATLKAARQESSSEPKVPCLRTDNPFFFTVKALGSQSYQYLFNSNTLAHKVVTKWYNNTRFDDELQCDEFKDLHIALKALYERLQINRYQELTFREMVMLQLTDDFSDPMDNLDKDLDELIEAEFRFPLLDPSTGSSHTRKIRLLNRFLEDYKGPDRGGMGNVPMDMFFDIPAAPWLFSDKFLDEVIFPMQNEVIPTPKHLVTPDGTVRKMGDEGWCCCNEQEHDIEFGGSYWRKCLYVNDPNVECMERNGYCKLGTLDACNPDHDHPD